MKATREAVLIGTKCPKNNMKMNKVRLHACHPLTFCPAARIMNYKIWRGPDILSARHKPWMLQ